MESWFECYEDGNTGMEEELEKFLQEMEHLATLRSVSQWSQRVPWKISVVISGRRT